MSVDVERLLDEPSYFVDHYLNVTNDDPDVPNEPFGYQREFLDNPSRRKVAVSGRRVGKSRMAAWLALWYAITHADADILITAKAQRQSMELFNQIKKEMRMSEFSEDDWGVGRDTRTEINFENGSRILCLPVGQDGSNIRGYGTDLLIVDEAAFIKEEIFQEVLSPMLAVGDGIFVLLSTPFGKRGFLYDRFEDAKKKDSEWHAMQVPTSANPLISDGFIEEQRQTLTSTQFKQEILGQFEESSDAFFLRDEVMNCAVSRDLEDDSTRVKQESDVCYLGVDLASTGGDESVYVSIDEKGNIFDIEHTTGKPLTDAMGRVKELDSYYNYTKIMVDSTGLGEGVVDQLKETVGRKVEGFKFSNEKKQSLYNTLKNEIQKQNIRFQFTPGKNEPENRMVAELLDLEFSFTHSGKIKISHPSGGHDDFSDALALAVWAKSRKRMARSDESMRPFNLGSLR